MWKSISSLLLVLSLGLSQSALAGGSHGIYGGPYFRPLCAVGGVGPGCVAPVRKSAFVAGRAVVGAGRLAVRGVVRAGAFAGRVVARTAVAAGRVAVGAARLAVIGTGRLLFGRYRRY